MASVAADKKMNLEFPYSKLKSCLELAICSDIQSPDSVSVNRVYHGSFSEMELQ